MMFRDLLIPLGMMMMLGSMIFPVHPRLLDILIVANLVLSVGLLLRALSVGDMLRLSTLPSMLLLATLFRLALNVSSTRLILSQGKAGQVIEAFGTVVVQGQVIVGLVVFLVITLIQFIVIAKGSERVAEVCARFTLDALPGKQMSIDADVRAGLIDFASAREKRQELQVESRFYGALDGAMKFVKGDAIAGMVIVAVNIFGGFIIGVVSEGLPVEAALRKFTLLTVGDGLASQIPALLTSLAAGMVVTRVQRGNEEPLSRELVAQLTQTKSVRLLLGGFSIALATLPAMPALPFLCLGVLPILSCVLPASKKKASVEEEVPRFVPRLPPLIELMLPMEFSAQGKKIMFALEEWRQDCFQRYGLIFNTPKLSWSKNLQRPQIKVRGVSERCLFEPLAEGIVTQVRERLDALVDGRAADFVDDAMTRRVIDQLERDAGEFVASVVPNVLTVAQITEILRELLREGISIRNSDLIIEAIAEAKPRVENSRDLLEEVRGALRRVIAAALTSDGELRAFTLQPEFELALHRSVRDGAALDSIAVNNLKHELQSVLAQGTARVLLVAKSVRRLVRDLLLASNLRCSVLSYDELLPDLEFVHSGVLVKNFEGTYDDTAVPSM